MGAENQAARVFRLKNQGRCVRCAEKLGEYVGRYFSCQSCRNDDAARLNRRRHAAKAEGVLCSFEGCTKLPRSKGMCSGHYNQQRIGKPLERLLTKSEAAYRGAAKRTLGLMLVRETLEPTPGPERCPRCWLILPHANCLPVNAKEVAQRRTGVEW
jgi:hypothetical protein